MMTWLALAATAASAILLFLLGIGNPKRRRAAGLQGGHDKSTRYLYSVGALTPGALIPLTGNAAMWLIWFGGCAVAGWLAALWLAQPAAEPRGRSERKPPAVTASAKS
jgi:hypothetical protein